MRAETVNAIVGERLPAGHLSRAVGRRGAEGAASPRCSASSRRSTSGWRRRRSIPRWSSERAAATGGRRDGDKARARSRCRDAGPRSRSRSCSRTLDHHWKEHLATLDALRQVVHLRAYAQKTPINEYKQEAFALFERMLDAIREDVTRILMRAQLQLEDRAAAGAAGLHHPASRSVHRRRRHCGHRRRDRRRFCPTCRRSTSRSRHLPQREPEGGVVEARSAATRHARAVRAGSTSIATGSSPDAPRHPRRARSTEPSCGAPIGLTKSRLRPSASSRRG